MTIKSLIGSHSRPMDKDEAKIMINAMMNPKLQEVFDEAASNDIGIEGRILQKRLAACSTAKITYGLAILVIVMSNGSPGNLVMWAYTFHKMNKGEVLTINDFAHYFPFGVPSERGLSETWESQKDHGMNLIDDVKNWN